MVSPTGVAKLHKLLLKFVVENADPLQSPNYNDPQKDDLSAGPGPDCMGISGQGGGVSQGVSQGCGILTVPWPPERWPS